MKLIQAIVRPTKVDFLPKVKVEVVVNDGKLATALEAIQHAAQTGEIGDG